MYIENILMGHPAEISTWASADFNFHKWSRERKGL